MTNEQLTKLVGARRNGRRVSVKHDYQEWAKRHKSLLRHALKHPREPVNLADYEKDETLRSLNFDRLVLLDGAKRWFHPDGDDVGNLVLLADRAKALADAAIVRRANEKEFHAIAMAYRSLE